MADSLPKIILSTTSFQDVYEMLFEDSGMKKDHPSPNLLLSLTYSSDLLTVLSAK